MMPTSYGTACAHHVTMRLAIAPATGRKEVRGRHARASAVRMVASTSCGVDVRVNEKSPRNRAMPTCSRCVRRVGTHVLKALARETTWKRVRSMTTALAEVAGRVTQRQWGRLRAQDGPALTDRLSTPAVSRVPRPPGTMKVDQSPNHRRGAAPHAVPARPRSDDRPIVPVSPRNRTR